MHKAATPLPGPARYWREWMLGVIASALLAGVMSLAPISQDPAYHEFADRRTFLGIPNFFNVTSNLAFLAVGIAGLVFLVRRQREGAWISWAVLFGGATLVAAGSTVYHWAPDNASLVWDRLPMTVGFMGLFVGLLAEHIDERLEKFALFPALLLGAASVAWWHYADDLRPYAWIQFMPLAILPLVVALFPGRYSHRRFLLYGLACYALAKAAEFFDAEFYFASGATLSGHSLKHLLAAMALLFVYSMLRRRALVAVSPQP